MISVTTKGSFQKTTDWLRRRIDPQILAILQQYGQRGISALAAATPIESGETANAWYYTVARTRGGYKLTWSNSHVENGTPIAIILQYGHGTGTGGYVLGRNYINPALQPIFDEINAQVWKVVKSG